jgi:hypothetical protein
MTNQEGEKKMSFLEKIKEKAKKVVRWFKKDKTQVFTGIAVSVVPSVCALGLAFFMANKAVGYANELNVYKYHVGVMAKFLSENQDVVDRFSAWVNEAK